MDEPSSRPRNRQRFRRWKHFDQHGTRLLSQMIEKGVQAERGFKIDEKVIVAFGNVHKPRCIGGKAPFLQAVKSLSPWPWRR